MPRASLPRNFLDTGLPHQACFLSIINSLWGRIPARCFGSFCADTVGTHVRRHVWCDACPSSTFIRVHTRTGREHQGTCTSQGMLEHGPCRFGLPVCFTLCGQHSSHLEARASKSQGLQHACVPLYTPLCSYEHPQRHLLTHQCYSLTLRSTKLRYSWSAMPRSCSLGYKCAPAPAVTRHTPQPTHTHIYSWAASSCKQHASV